MKRRVIFILMIIISLLLSSCSTDEFTKAEKFLEKGDTTKAIEIYNELIAKDSDLEAYERLIYIYKKDREIEKLTEVVESVLKIQPLDLDESIYLDIFEYYKANGDMDKINQLLTKSFSSIKLPNKIYEEYIVQKHIPEGMEIIETKTGDLNMDGNPEIAIVMGLPQDNAVPKSYEVMRIAIYDTKGNVLYEEESEGFDYYPMNLEFVDLTGDGNLDIFYSFHMIFGSSRYDYPYVLSYVDNKIEDILVGSQDFNIGTAYLDENTVKIFSQDIRQAYTIKIDPEYSQYLELFNDDYIEIKSEIIDLVKNQDDRYILQKSVELKLYSNVVVDLEYRNGKFENHNMNIELYDGQKIVSSKEVQEYDSLEYGKNLIMGNWSQYFYDEEYRVRVDGDMIYVYQPNSEIFDQYNYKVVSCDEEKGKVTISMPEGQEIFEVNGYDLTITARNGNISKWKKL